MSMRKSSSRRMGSMAVVLLAASASGLQGGTAIITRRTGIARPCIALAPLTRTDLLSCTSRRQPPPLMVVDSSAESVPESDEQGVDNVQDALAQTAIAVAAACAFGAGVFAMRGGEDASAWFAAYVLEESLSVDNLFVFSLIFDYFKTPAFAQPRVLRWGLIGAVVLRGSFIFAGLAVVERFKGVLLVRSASVVAIGAVSHDALASCPLLATSSGPRLPCACASGAGPVCGPGHSDRSANAMCCAVCYAGLFRSAALLGLRLADRG